MHKSAILIILLMSGLNLRAQKKPGQPQPEYLRSIRIELAKKWPENKTINLVFHGHSVPAGYFVTPDVNTLEAYPYQVLTALKKHYPFAVINIINTAIGGENSESGQRRFKREVLPHDPNVLFIDYALNDRGIGLKKAKNHWEKMIKSALKQNIKIILLTPSPDQTVDILESNNILEQHAVQIRALAQQYRIGLVDSHELFKNKIVEGHRLDEYMSQVNHPNKLGHALIAKKILTYFN